jgi:ribonuclease Z
MFITFIGTGSGKTSLKRSHSSILINYNGHNLLIDAGDGISRALMKQDIDPAAIDSILISHFHPDHAGGISSLVNQMHLLQRVKPLSIYVHENLNDALISLLNVSYIFPEKLKFTLDIITFQSDEETRIKDTFKFISKQNGHLSNKYSIEHMPESAFISSSFLVRLNDYNILYTADVGDERDLYLFENNKIDLLICETTHTTKEAVLKADDVLNPERTYLVHIDDKDEAVLADFIASHESTNIFLAYDGLKITF